MARIDSQVIFLTTSPRTPEKMVPEIDLLIQNFEGQIWNIETQTEFMEVLRDEQFFNGEGAKDPAFSARDRINRAPKALGFVSLSPKISLTPAGEKLISAKRKEEVFLRQFLKFQVPSPYHKPSAKAADFCIKPYLEMLRLVRKMGSLKFDELQIFGMQLTNWHDFDNLVEKINKFRDEKFKNKGNYRAFKKRTLETELKRVYSGRIANGETKTRESNDKSLAKFLDTQGSNMRDYADACFRYLRATGLVNVSHIGKSLSIIPERIIDVDFILETVDRNPCYIDNEYQYSEYLGNPCIPQLLTDNKQKLIEKLHSEFPNVDVKKDSDIQSLKDTLSDLSEQRLNDNIAKQIKEIKDYKLYDEIQDTYKKIKNLYDAPLMLEWNTWRAMTMLDGGNIKANLNFDDFGKPLSTAAGNMSDIVCDYDDYMLSVEVTMATGQKQYEMEGEPVSRHLGKLKTSTGKPAYCLFVAPTINEACIAYFFMLHKTNISYYGGKSVIIPLNIATFQKMLQDSYKANYTPSPSHVQKFFEYSMSIAENCDDATIWYNKINDAAAHWLAC